MKKIDIHCHLDGSLPLDTVKRLAKRSRIEVPFDDENLMKRLQAPDDCNSLLEYLQCFDLPVSCLQTEENLYEATRDVILDAQKDDVIYMEIRFAPRLHMQCGMSIENILESVTAGLQDAKRMTGIEAGMIVCGMRNHNVKDNLKMLECALDYRTKGICGLDIAGDEVNYPPQIQKELFLEAKRMKMPFTIHAGECGSVDNVLWSIRMEASRIGHGIALKDNPDALKECKERQIALELCPVSNYQTKAVKKEEEYPLRIFMDAGIPVTINTDNRTVSNTTLQKEFDLMQRKTGLSHEEKRQILLNSIQYSFAEESIKEKLKEYV